jgi:hypothetical protein
LHLEFGYHTLTIQGVGHETFQIYQNLDRLPQDPLEKKIRCEPKLNELAIFAMDANARIATFDVCDPAHGLPQVVAALFVDYSAPTTALELWRISSQMGR